VARLAVTQGQAGCRHVPTRRSLWARLAVTQGPADRRQVPTRRSLALLTCLAVTLTGWAGATASAAPPGGAPTTPEAGPAITGTLLVTADGPADESPYALATDDGRVVGLADPAGRLAGIEPGATIAVDLEPSTGLPSPPDAAPTRPAPVKAPAGRAPTTAQIVAAAHVLATATAPRAESLTPAPHALDVVLLSNDGTDRFLTDAQLHDLASQISTFWRRESRGVVTEFAVGSVGTAGFDPANRPFPCAGTIDVYQSLMVTAASALGTTWTQYVSFRDALGRPSQNPGRRHLVVLMTNDFLSQWGQTCDVAASGSLGLDLMSSGVLWARVDAANPAGAGADLVHELGHNLGLGHAAATRQSCVDPFWDGPFDATIPAPAQTVSCPIGWNVYKDWHNVMGSGTRGILDDSGTREVYPRSPQDAVIISGQAKVKLGLITPGAGLVAVSPTPADQVITINQTQTQDRAAPQSILLTETVPGCGTQVHALDFDPAVGGVRVARVPDARDCDTQALAAAAWADSIVLTTDAATGRQDLPVGQSRVTQSGQTEITVLSQTATTATVRLRPLGPPRPAVSVYPTELRLAATGDALQVGATTNQSGWKARSDQKWLTLAPSSGLTRQQFTVTGAANPSAAERVATVTITAGKAKTTLRVVQAASEPSAAKLKLSKTTWTPAKGSRSTKISVTADQAWRVVDAPSWATVTVTGPAGNGNQKVQVQVERNTGPVRSGAVRLATTGSTPAASAALLITQKGTA